MNISKSNERISRVIGISSFLAGSYYGFCNSHGIYLGDLEFILKYGGTITQGIFCGAVVGKEGWKHKGIIFSSQKFDKGKITQEEYEETVNRFERENREDVAIPGPTLGFLLGLGGGGITAGIATVVGYGLGYLTGNLTK